MVFALRATSGPGRRSGGSGRVGFFPIPSFSSFRLDSFLLLFNNKSATSFQHKREKYRLAQCKRSSPSPRHRGALSIIISSSSPHPTRSKPLLSPRSKSRPKRASVHHRSPEFGECNTRYRGIGIMTTRLTRAWGPLLMPVRITIRIARKTVTRSAMRSACRLMAGDGWRL